MICNTRLDKTRQDKTKILNDNKIKQCGGSEELHSVWLQSYTSFFRLSAIAELYITSYRTILYYTIPFLFGIVPSP